MTPNKENIRKWVDALRSGDYVQAKGRLRNDDGCMCVWGVACEVSGLGAWQDDWAGDTVFYSDTDGECEYEPPLEVEEWLGVPFEEDGLADLNDVSGWTFELFADYLEEKYL